MKDCRAKT